MFHSILCLHHRLRVCLVIGIGNEDAQVRQRKCNCRRHIYHLILRSYEEFDW